MRSSTGAATRALFHPAEMKPAEIAASVTKSANAPRFSRASHARLRNHQQHKRQPQNRLAIGGEIEDDAGAGSGRQPQERRPERRARITERQALGEPECRARNYGRSALLSLR